MRPSTLFTASAAVLGLTLGATVLVGPSAAGAAAPHLAVTPSIDAAPAITVTPRTTREPNTGCYERNVAHGDGGHFRTMLFQALANQTAQDVTSSQWSVRNGRGTLTTPDPLPVAVGARTPHMEGIGVLDSKRITYGTNYSTDNFYNGNTFGCETLAPFIIGPGPIGDARTWAYNGNRRTPATAGGANPQWWGFPRRTHSWGPAGWFTWTCRTTPTSTSQALWQTVSSGTGFRGDAGATDRADRASGVAPSCRDRNLAEVNVTTRYAVSREGRLQGRNDTSYPRHCSVQASSLVGCWNETYPGGWNRVWNVEHHIFTSALRADLTTETRIRVPAAYDEDGVGFTRAVSWRITDGRISGEWPDFTDQAGTRHHLNGLERRATAQDWTQPSAFTVPTRDTFRLSGYGTPRGQQFMQFTLTADTDGTWTWPRDEKGRELPRPQVRVVLRYDINNFDDGTQCRSALWGNNAFFTDNNRQRCLDGTVPTIWPLPEDANQRARKQIDDFVIDADGRRVRNRPTAEMEHTVVRSCWNESQLRVQDLSPDTAPVVGADFTWSIRLSGLIDSFASC